MNKISAPFLLLIRIILFWIVLFGILRLTFVIYYIKIIFESGAVSSEILKSFWYAMPLDLSMASYLSLLSWLIISFQIIVNKPFVDKLHKVVIYILIFTTSLITVGEIGIYAEWKTKLNMKALEYLKNPSEIIESDKTSLIIIKIALLFLLFFVLKYIFDKFFFKQLNKERVLKWVFVPFFLISPIFLFYSARGGFGEIPISQSSVYFSKNNIINDISVNSCWNLIYDYSHNSEIYNKNLFEQMPVNEAENIVNNLHNNIKDTSIFILKTTKPNVVIILLESFSADLIESLGGKPGLDTEFEKLQKSGLLFTNLYSSGNRSQQGIAAILGGFPALPITTLTTTPQKMHNTPTITEIFNTASYKTSFYYGGQLQYGNIKAYLIHNKFNNIKEEADFINKYPKGKLGVHDEFMFNELLEQTNKNTEPFFSILFTLSSHSPYDQPSENIIKWGDSEDAFLNSAYYTDKCIGNFFAKAKKEKWYRNTLFILVADHSHNTYRHWAINQKEYRHIPMLFYGDVLKDEYKGEKYTKICSQTDLTTTLLKQLNLDASAFFWSKNLFNPTTKEFAYFELNEGFGWITPEGYLSYNHFNKMYFQNTYNDSIKTQKQNEGSAYLQVLFQKFIDL